MAIPFEIRRVKNPDATTSLIAVVSINDAMKTSSTKEDLAELQKQYLDLLINCQKHIKLIQKNRVNASDAKRHWRLGDLLLSYIDMLEKKEFYFAHAIPTLARDVNLSERYIAYHIKFRKEYSSLQSIHDKIKWWGYQELLDVPDKRKRKLCEKKLLNGEIKTMDHLRSFKKSLKFHE